MEITASNSFVLQIMAAWYSNFDILYTGCGILLDCGFAVGDMVSHAIPCSVIWNKQDTD